MSVADGEVIIELRVDLFDLIIFGQDEIDLSTGVSNHRIEPRSFCLGCLNQAA